jgi:hypothetical protein
MKNKKNFNVFFGFATIFLVFDTSWLCVPVFSLVFKTFEFEPLVSLRSLPSFPRLDYFSVSLWIGEIIKWSFCVDIILPFFGVKSLSLSITNLSLSTYPNTPTISSNLNALSTFLPIFCASHFRCQIALHCLNQSKQFNLIWMWFVFLYRQTKKKTWE